MAFLLTSPCKLRSRIGWVRIGWVVAIALFAPKIVGCNHSSATVSAVPIKADSAASMNDGKGETAPGSAASSTAASPAAVALAPKAIVPKVVHDFQVMPPQTGGEHEFEIKNEGNAPLTLVQGESTCKCTLTKLANNAIAPGESATVKLEWNTGPKAGAFGQSVEVLTNDPHPARKRLKFRVMGVVEVALAANEEGLSFGSIFPSVPQSVRMTIYSQAWPEFRFDEIASSVEGLTWKVEPASAELLATFQAKSGFNVTFTSPEKIDSGSISGSLRLKASPINVPDKLSERDQELWETHELEFPIYGAVRSPIAVLGSSIDEFGTINLGRNFAGEGATAHLKVKVSDSQRVIQVKKIEVNPAYVEATLTPAAKNVGETGLYDLTIKLPTDAPVGSFTGDRRGSLLIETDHAKRPTLKLNLDFVVVNLRDSERPR